MALPADPNLRPRNPERLRQARRLAAAMHGHLPRRVSARTGTGRPHNDITRHRSHCLDQHQITKLRLSAGGEPSFGLKWIELLRQQSGDNGTSRVVRTINTAVTLGSNP